MSSASIPEAKDPPPWSVGSHLYLQPQDSAAEGPGTSSRCSRLCQPGGGEYPCLASAVGLAVTARSDVVLFLLLEGRLTLMLALCSPEVRNSRNFFQIGEALRRVEVGHFQGALDDRMTSRLAVWKAAMLCWPVLQPARWHRAVTRNRWSPGICCSNVSRANWLTHRGWQMILTGRRQTRR